MHGWVRGVEMLQKRETKPKKKGNLCTRRATDPRAPRHSVPYVHLVRPHCPLSAIEFEKEESSRAKESGTGRDWAGLRQREAEEKEKREGDRTV